MHHRNSWQPIETLTKHRDRKVDLWVKWWRADTDTFDGRRYTNCYWNSEQESWQSLDLAAGEFPKNVRVTHWRDMPLSPYGELQELPNRLPQVNRVDCPRND